MRCLRRIKFNPEHTGLEKEEAEMIERMVKEGVEVEEEGVVDLQCLVQVVLCHQCLDCLPTFQGILGHHLSLVWKDFSPHLASANFLQDFLHTLLQDFHQECFPLGHSQVI